MADEFEKLTDSQALAAHWTKELSRAHEAFGRYFAKCDSVLTRYFDERTGSTEGEKRANLHWASIETVKPSIFSSVPQADIRRRNAGKDIIKQISAEIWERAARYSAEEHQDLYQVFERVRDDYLILSRGITWERYEVEFEDVEEELPVEAFNQIQDKDGLEATVNEESATVTIKYKKKVSEKAITDYVCYDDFLHNPARTEDEIRWKARRHRLNFKEKEKRFGAKLARAIKPDISLNKDYQPDNDDNPAEDNRYKQSEIWEIWDKQTKERIFVSPGYKDIIEQTPDPLGLENFFPTPASMVMVRSKTGLIPTPEYCIVQDLLREIDELTDRISAATRALRIVGIYPAEFGPLVQRLLEKDNELVPIPNWPLLERAGGLNVIQWLPVEQIVGVLSQLYSSRQSAIDLYYEITGYSDILRGASDPRETATAQELKYSNAGVRLKCKQRQFQKYIRDAMAIKAEIIAEHFDAETLYQMTGIDGFSQPIDEQTFFQCVELLKSQSRRSYEIDIETDSTIAADESRERGEMAEFMAAVSPMLAQILPILQQSPALAPPMAEIILGVTRKYRLGRSVEGMLSEAIGAMQEEMKAAAGQPPPVDPMVEQLRVQNEIEARKDETKRLTEQATAALKMKELEAETVINQQKLMVEQQKLREDWEKFQREFWLKLQELMMQLSTDTAANEIKATEVAIKAEQASVKKEAEPKITLNIDATAPGAMI